MTQGLSLLFLALGVTEVPQREGRRDLGAIPPGLPHIMLLGMPVLHSYSNMPGDNNSSKATKCCVLMGNTHSAHVDTQTKKQKQLD